jgi:hypothetical protein
LKATTIKETKNNHVPQIQRNLPKGIFVAIGNIQATEQTEARIKKSSSSVDISKHLQDSSRIS